MEVMENMKCIAVGLSFERQQSIKTYDMSDAGFYDLY